MWPVFEQSLNRYQQLEQQLADPVVIADRSRFASVAREHGALSRQVKPYLEYKSVCQGIEQAETLLAEEADPEMRALAEEELTSLRARRAALQGRLEDFLLVDPG